METEYNYSILKPKAYVKLKVLNGMVEGYELFYHDGRHYIDYPVFNYELIGFYMRYGYWPNLDLEYKTDNTCASETLVWNR